MRNLPAGMQLLTPADYRRMRWKNGQGWTTEITLAPADAGLNSKPFDWRISMAEIEQDGEFSVFAGYDRSILLAEGAGMELHFDAAPSARLDTHCQPLRFKGEWHTHCHLLDGPVRDFNVMSARARWQHECRVTFGAGVQLAAEPGAQTLLVHCLHGGAELHNRAGSRLGLQAGDTLVCTTAALTQPFETQPGSSETVLVNVSLTPVARA